MKNRSLLTAIVLLVVVTSGSASAADPPGDGPAQKVLGIGGFFFKSENPERLAQWYETNLGVSVTPTRKGQQPWRQEAGTTAFTPFAKDTTYFGKPEQVWMINFRVADLKAMVAQLRAAGIAVEETQSDSYGDFARLRDPEGNPIELWEPRSAK